MITSPSPLPTSQVAVGTKPPLGHTESDLGSPIMVPHTAVPRLQDPPQNLTSSMDNPMVQRPFMSPCSIKMATCITHRLSSPDPFPINPQAVDTNPVVDIISPVAGIIKHLQAIPLLFRHRVMAHSLLRVMTIYPFTLPTSQTEVDTRLPHGHTRLILDFLPTAHPMVALK